jgi:hypothetical protein
MSVEAQAIIDQAKQVHNQSANGRLVTKATRFMTHRERTERQAELERVEETLSPANVAASVLSQDGRAQLARYRSHLKHDLQQNSPPADVSGETKDAIARETDVLASKIREGMLTQEEMRRNPSGAIGRHMRWERTHKADILAWKNLRRALEPDNDDPDLANIERLRPSAVVPGAAPTFMADAQIPGVFAMSSQAKANWPLGDPKVETPLSQAERRELEELRAAKEARVQRGRALAAKTKEAREAKADPSR